MHKAHSHKSERPSKSGYFNSVTDERVKMNVCVFGPHRSGKSTFLGHLLVKAGCIDAGTAQQIEQKAAKADRKDLKYAWLVDTLPEERSTAKPGTVTAKQHLLVSNMTKTTRTMLACLTDTPGSGRHIKNMLSQLQTCSLGVLVVSASVGQFERCIAPTTVTSTTVSLRDQLVAAFTMGIRELCICVTQMDHASVAFSRERFEAVQESLVSFCKIVGIANVTAIPVSGWVGTNISRHRGRDGNANHMPWYSGPNFVEFLTKLCTTKKPTTVGLSHEEVSGPAHRTLLGGVSAGSGASSVQSVGAATRAFLRLPITKVYMGPGRSTLTLVGRIESGVLPLGSTIEILSPIRSGRVVDKTIIPQTGSSRAPPREYRSDFTVSTRKVLSLEVFHTKCNAAEVGDTVGICIAIGDSLHITEEELAWADMMTGCKAGSIVVGGVLGSGESTSSPEAALTGVRYCQYFEAQVMILHAPGMPGVSVGYAPIVDVQSAHVQCEITDLIIAYDRHSAQIVDTHPSVLRTSMSAIIRLRPLTPLCLEPFHVCPSMGRLVLREGSKIVAVGVVRHVKKVSQ